MKLYSARYQNPALADGHLAAVRITAYPPRFTLNFPLAAAIPHLAPPGEWLKLPHAELQARYRLHLKKYVSYRDVRAQLERISAENDGKDVVVLCFEDLRVEYAFCHRRWFARWWFDHSGELVDELADWGPRTGNFRQAPQLSLGL